MIIFKPTYDVQNSSMIHQHSYKYDLEFIRESQNYK